MNSVVELHFGFFYFFRLIHVVVPLSTFLKLKAELFFNSFRAVISLREKLFFSLVTVISASCALTFSK